VKFLSPWNQFLLALVLLNDPDKRTMAGVLQIGIEDVGVEAAGSGDAGRRAAGTTARSVAVSTAREMSFGG
jgi:ABC-type glycerol-3-phosphate transport system permease component